ncbi:MAG: hypothetical protein IJ930_06930 [Lachnospiraceae bacterium]|nr:hypothetical protein [Lachnospiraceae bacterium]
MPVYDQIMKRKEYLENLLEKTKHRLDAAPPGKLRVSSRCGKPQYYLKTDFTTADGTYLDREHMDAAYVLGQKDYDRKLCEAIEKELGAIDRYLRSLPPVIAEDIYNRMPKSRKLLVSPVVEPIEEAVRKWEETEYEGKPFADGAPEFYTDKGERVRSKSEMIIANLLFKEGIHYKYECPVLLTGFGRVFPDFTILDPRTRKEVIWEHLGMMDDPDYAASALKKQAAYIMNGYFPGENIIFTAESNDAPLNVRVLKSIIRHCLLGEE